jgi:hypothetical protein
MKQQDYKNHRRLSITYHVFTLFPLLALAIAAIIYLFKASGDNFYNAVLIAGLVYISASLYIHARVFALRVQDRAIRAEEGLRYFILTGKRMDTRLTLPQIIALRFASDEELPSLAARAVEEGMSSNGIKKQIRNWKQDPVPRA